ncbi:MAG TPA: hypothetical protein VK646_05670 [Actinomycetota bacterium]|nr:hypothetical protein [Actinomycetota bacterium]
MAAGHEALHGTWSLEAYEDRDAPAREWTRTYGRARGIIAYDPTGALSVVITAGPGATDEGWGLAYVGRFEVASWNEHDGVVEGVVLHHMEGASDPSLFDDGPERIFRLEGDTLEIGDDITYRRRFRRAT